MITLSLAVSILAAAALTPTLLRLMESRVPPKAVALLAGGLALASLSIWAFLIFGPRDYLIVLKSWTGLPVDFIHPYMLALYSAASALVSILLVSALAIRFFRLRKG